MDRHLFICVNRRENGRKSCADSGTEELRCALKERVKKGNWKEKIRINASGCLGRCEEGGVAVLYPEGKWFTELRPGSDQMLEDALSLTEKEGSSKNIDFTDTEE